MSIAEQVRSVALQEYRLVRSCVQAVDQRIGPVIETAPGMDAVLSRLRHVLHDLDDRVSGDDRVTPSYAETGTTADAAAAPAEAAVADDFTDEGDATTNEPASNKPAASSKPAASNKPAASRQDDTPEVSVEPQEVEHLAEELLEDERDHHAGELADNDELREVQARLRAKHALQERDDPQA